MSFFKILIPTAAATATGGLLYVRNTFTEQKVDLPQTGGMAIHFRGIFRDKVFYSPMHKIDPEEPHDIVTFSSLQRLHVPDTNNTIVLYPAKSLFTPSKLAKGWVHYITTSTARL